jgi:hypothetical protein
MSEYCDLTPDDFKNPEQIDASKLTFSSFEWKDGAPEGWTRLGEATLTVEIPSVDDIINSKVDSLKAQVKSIRAEAEAKANFVESQINTLLAIEYAPG